jgi:predicted alpha/beta superfamily hydrolase
MKNLFKISSLLLLFCSCRQTVENKKADTLDKQQSLDITSKLYSRFINDTFAVSVCLPNNYFAARNKTFPVVYLLDANLYFDIVAATFKKYSDVGLLPPAILVGIGYKDFMAMDSLRSRDYTFPTAIPEYEMSVSGQADKFLSFIKNELVPDIDAKYAVDKNARVLMGHSLGGYFTLYALTQNSVNKDNVFSTYIAASPSTFYNHNYILKELEKINLNKNISAYITFGGLEDAEEENDPTMLKTSAVISSLTKSLRDKINYRCDDYSNLGHMDTQLPTFIKGLQWTLLKER